MPKSRSLKDLIGDNPQANPTGTGPDQFVAAPDQSQTKSSTIGGAIKSAAGEGFAEGVKANPNASFIDKAQFGVAGTRDSLLELVGQKP